MAEFPLPVLQIWRSRKRVAIQIQLMNIHVSECKYYCFHLVPKFGDMCDRQNWRLHPTDIFRTLSSIPFFPDKSRYHRHGSHAVLISGKCAYFETWASRPWKSPYFWIFSIEVREKSWFSIAVSKPGWSTLSCASWGFSKCCGNDVELFGNPSDPLTNHRWCVVWRHLVPAKIPRASFIKFYYVVTESQSADTWCHVVVVRNLIGPQSRRYTWRMLCKTSSIFVEIQQDWIPQMNGQCVRKLHSKTKW